MGLDGRSKLFCSFLEATGGCMGTDMTSVGLGKFSGGSEWVSLE